MIQAKTVTLSQILRKLQLILPLKYLAAILNCFPFNIFQINSLQILMKPFLMLICTLLLVVTAHGSENGIEYPENIAERLQSRYDKIKSLTFNFIQNSSGDITGRPRRGTGKAAFLKLDGKSYMRWDYTNPDQQVLTSDGELFSMYFAKLQQMIITPADRLEADLTYSFFTGKGILKKDFHIRPADEEFQPANESEFKVIKLIPKTAQSQVQDIHLWVTKCITHPPHKNSRSFWYYNRLKSQ